MIIFPAIDIMDGKPVRLLRGDFDTAEQVAEDVLTTAKQFARVGCTWVHMVDLDGSLQKKPVNADPILQVAAGGAFIPKLLPGAGPKPSVAALQGAL